MGKERMAILMIGFDGYNDLWKDFFYLLKKNWPDCPYKIYLSNNELDYEVPGVITLHSGKNAEWSRKVQDALKVIEEEYICLLLEDFYVGASVDTKEIEKILTFMKTDQIRYYKLNTFTRFKTSHYKNYSFLYTIPENMPYGISLLPGIWKKNFLAEKLGTDNYNAWKFECNRLAEEKGKGNQALEGCVFDSRNILQIQHGVVQGKYLPEVIKYFRKQGYELNQSVRKTMSFKENFIYKCKRLDWPVPVKRVLKMILRKTGMKFVSDENA